MYHLYLRVDEHGTILKAYAGDRVIPEEPYDIFIYDAGQDVIDQIDRYRVEMDGFTPRLVEITPAEEEPAADTST